ncbi:MAG: right-handed parallel beta-helix repeat-containing protein, partial [Thermomicrobiales bacterium]
MNQNAFDRIANELGRATSRRSGLMAALGAVLGKVGGPSAVEAGTRKAGERAHGPSVTGPCGPSPRDNKCKKDKQCCTGYCKPGKKGKSGRCRCAPKNHACTAKTTCCAGLACTNGACKPAGPPPVACDVCLNGCDYSSVEAAYAAASDGDTILIDAGLYPTAIDLDKSITLQACHENGGSVILQYKDSTTAILTDPDTTALSVTLKGLDFAESGVGSGKTLILGKTKVGWSVTGCNFLNAGSGLNIAGTGATPLTVTDCTFDNVVSPIMVLSANLTITGSTFTHARNAISVLDDAITPVGFSVTDSTFTANATGMSYRGFGQPAIAVTGCTIKDSNGPAMDFIGGTVTISGCTITGNTVTSSGGGGRFSDAAVTI